MLAVRLQTHDEDVMVTAFEQGIAAEPFSDSLIRNPTETFSNIREQVVAHIEAEEAIVKKNDNLHLRQSRSKESARGRPLRVNETLAEKRTNSRYVLYIAKRDEPKTKGREESDTFPRR